VAFGLTRRLLGVSERLSSGVSLDEVCHRVADLARTGTGVTHAVVRVVGNDPEVAGSDPVLKALLDVSLDVSLDGEDGPVRELVLCSDRQQVQRLLRGRLVGYDVEAAAIVPLRSVTGVVAHVALWSPTERRWTQEDEQFLVGLGTQAGQAITRALA
jgi:GAF domain-containing protein